MDIRVNEHKGMATQIAHEKLPIYLYQKIHNLELSKKIGRMVKRGGYTNVLTSGLTALKGMKEFTDSNGGRQILLQDGTGLEESVYTAGAYVASSAISLDERTASKQVTQMYPVLHEEVLRSGAGITSANDHAFWYGYLSRDRCNDLVTIVDGKYLDNQFVNSKMTTLVSNFIQTYLKYDGSMTDEGIQVDKVHGVYFSPVIDGYQRGLPVTSVVYTAETTATSTTPEWVKIQIALDATYRQYAKRITAIDIFITQAPPGTYSPEILSTYPAYFLERIDFNTQGRKFLTLSGTLETATPPTYVEFTRAFAEFETFYLTDFMASFTASVAYNKVLGVRTENSTKVRYAIAGLVNADSGDSVTCQIYPGWYLDTDYKYTTMFDDYYKKLGSEMYTYLNVPAGDSGISDPRYKFSCMANKRYFIFGTVDGPFGYYSKVGNPDVIPSQNILRLQREPTGCVNVGRDVIVFYPSNSKRFTILSNANAEEDDTFSNIGLVSQKAIVSIDDENAYGFDLRGPWELHLRNHRFIGSLLTDWWEDELSEAEKNACVVSYNRLKDWVMYSFPTYTGTHDSQTYTGIIFVFDRGYYLKSGRQIEPWWIIKTDHLLYNWTIAEDDDLHLLTGSKTAVVDWNVAARASQTESVTTLAHLKFLKNPILGNKTHFDMLYLYYVSATDAMVAKQRPDGGSWATLTVNDDQQAVLKYLCETLEIELSTAASKNDVEISEEILTFTPLRGA